MFWVVELAEDEVQISNEGRRASMHAEDVPVIDSFQFGGLKMVPAKVSFSVEWQAKGPAKPLGKPPVLLVAESIHIVKPVSKVPVPADLALLGKK